MSIKSWTKSPTFVLAMLVLFVGLLPFAVEQIGDATDWFKFPATMWVKGLFSTKSERESKVQAKVAWDRQLADLKAFSDWADGQEGVKISVVRPEVFEIVWADPNPVTTSHFSWKLRLLSDTLSVNATQVKEKLRLICHPKDKVSYANVSVKPLDGEEKGFLVTVDGVRGAGKMGLSYKELPPTYYDVKLRRLWLVPVASCRSAMKDRYESAVFFPGMEKGLPEGAVISPSDDKCGYRILSISDYCVWFEAFYGDEPPEDILPHSIWPDFSRVDTMKPTPPPGRLIFGRNRCFWPGDAIKLPNSGNYLKLDDLLAGRAAMFRMLGPDFRPIRKEGSDLLCVIVREKKK